MVVIYRVIEISRERGREGVSQYTQNRKVHGERDSKGDSPLCFWPGRLYTMFRTTASERKGMKRETGRGRLKEMRLIFQTT